MTIKLKLAATFLAVFLLSGIAGLVAVRDFNHIDAQLTEMIENQVQNTVKVQELNSAQLRLKAAIREHLITRNEGAMRRLEDEMVEARAQQKDAMDALEAAKLDPEGRALLDEYTALRKGISEINNKAIEFSKKNDLEGASNLLLDPDYLATQKKREELAAAIVAQQLEALDAAESDVQAIMDEAKKMLIGLPGACGRGGDCGCRLDHHEHCRGPAPGARSVETRGGRRPERPGGCPRPRRDRRTSQVEQPHGGEAARSGGRRLVGGPSGLLGQR